MVLPRIVKPKTQRAKRALGKKEPKIFENDKNAMFVKGSKTSETVNNVLKDLYALKKPLGVMYNKKNDIRPFENETSLEFFADKSDCSLFIFCSHSKKRPHNIVMGRLFDGHVLDMVEMGVENYKSLASFKIDKTTFGTKPCLIFSGEAFDQDPEFKRLKNLFTDFFRGPVADNIRLQGLEHAFMFTAADGKIYARSYKIHLKKSGTRTPRVELEEIGPSVNLVLRRTKLGSDDLFKRACRVPKQAKANKKKNIGTDVFGTKKGRIHMTKQDLGNLQTRKMKGLKRGNDKKETAEASDEGSPTKQSKSDSDSE